MQLAGKVVIVTGAAQGIGEAYAKGIAAAGASVVVADIDLAKAETVAHDIDKSGGKAIAVSVDVVSPEACAKMAKAAKDAFGGIDGLVNNAAIFGSMKMAPLLTVDLDYYYKFMNVNMHGALIATRACYEAIAARGGGSVINQSSSAAYMNGVSFYGLAKVGMNGLTMALSKELGPHKIRVNGIAPGPTGTQALLSTTPKEVIDALIGSMAIQRLGEPQDMVGTAVFLLSDASAWMTAQTLIVDGGTTCRY